MDITEWKKGYECGCNDTRKAHEAEIKLAKLIIELIKTLDELKAK